MVWSAIGRPSDPPAANVAYALFSHGRSALAPLVRLTGLPSRKLAACLFVLVHHGIVAADDNDPDAAAALAAGRIITYYTLLPERLLVRLALPRFMEVAERLFLAEGLAAVWALVRHGRLSYNDLVAEVLGTDADAEVPLPGAPERPTPTFTRLMFDETLDRLLAGRWVVPFTLPSAAGPTPELIITRATGMDVAEALANADSLPTNRLKRDRATLDEALVAANRRAEYSAQGAASLARPLTVADLRSNPARGLSGVDAERRAREENSGAGGSLAAASTSANEDKLIFLSLNTDRFMMHLRHEALIEAARQRVAPAAGALLQTILSLVEPEMAARCSDPVTRIKSPVVTRNMLELAMQQGGANKHGSFIKSEAGHDPAADLDTLLALLAHPNPMRFLRRRGDLGGGTYWVDIRAAVAGLQLAEITAILRERLGDASARIFRLLLDKHYLEQKEIAQTVLIPSADARAILFQMMVEGFISVQEVPRTPDRAVARSLFLFSASLPEAVEHTFDMATHIVLRTRLRLRYELEVNGVAVIDQWGERLPAAISRRKEFRDRRRVRWRAESAVQSSIGSWLLLAGWHVVLNQRHA
ncbi:hypothetical protein H696_04703 [Fonticula alba]|uniref:DNA-directed RNA polymerase III subunit RPC3 n=1 Tax=Fonticula alba TaxID=691883 RepID=A0A058Z3A7_FONAL|nr:hypothetical protein H696_04703 [Fonticula alba]KCV68408.1 hypothetical protein H696_04703 [Fonticula alba]|eukprot:XP_009496840.1 hypothetical protein H696_04703 [Fonticula alba]